MRKYSLLLIALSFSASSLAYAQTTPQATPTGPVTAQSALGGGTAPQVNTNNVQSPAGQTFDPATRLFSSTHPPLTDPNAPQAAPVITPEQQAEMDRQKQLEEIQQKRADAKAKMEKAKAEQKKRQQAQKDADAKRMDMLKAARADRMKQMKENREELAKLLQEEKDARKAYQDAKKNSTGSTQTTDDDFRKAEKDRQKKIQELRHPKYKPITSQSVSGTGNNTTSGSTGTSTALPGTTTTGNGPNATTH